MQELNVSILETGTEVQTTTKQEIMKPKTRGNEQKDRKGNREYFKI